MKIVAGIVVFIVALWAIGWKVFGLGTGRTFGNEVADHLNLDHNFFHSVLDNGLPASLSVLNKMRKDGLTPEGASIRLSPFLQKGLTKLEARFGHQPQLDETWPIVAELLTRLKVQDADVAASEI